MLLYQVLLWCDDSSHSMFSKRFCRLPVFIIAMSCMLGLWLCLFVYQVAVYGSATLVKPSRVCPVELFHAQVLYYDGTYRVVENSYKVSGVVWLVFCRLLLFKLSRFSCGFVLWCFLSSWSGCRTCGLWIFGLLGLLLLLLVPSRQLWSVCSISVEVWKF